MIHSFNQFHRAGHGTFFSGLLQSGLSRKRKPFLWIYDCGSKRYSRIPLMVKHLHAHANTDTIDLLCVSHFDGDHVNGMTALLKQFKKVAVLALPYIPFYRRLGIAFDLMDMNAASVDAISFALDPIGYLERRGLLQKVGRVLLIKGDGASAAEPSSPREGGDSNNPEDEFSLSFDKISTEGLNEYPTEGTENNTRKKLKVVSDSVVGNVINADWEFVFFNKPLPISGTRKTQKPIAAVQADVKAIVSSVDLCADPKEFFKQLRSTYDKHFDCSSAGRNDISLCVLSRSMHSSRARGCRRFCVLGKYPLDIAYNVIPLLYDGNKSALLLTGDISIDSNTAKQMRSHFGNVRWNDVYVMQIPHHGSEYSWEKGVAKEFQNLFSVLCVPNFHKKGLHPHNNVMKDIDKKNPIRADYSSSVIFTFHKNET